MVARPEPNRYVYVNAQPLSWIDRDGREAIGAVVGGIVGGMSGFLGAKAAGASTGEVLIGAGFGALTGVAVGALDPTGGILTVSAVTESAALSGLAGGLGNLAGQIAANKLNNKTAFECINAGSVLGSAAGSAAGGAMGKILTELASTLPAAQTTLGQWTAQTMQAIGAVPSFVGEQAGSALATSGGR